MPYQNHVFISYAHDNNKPVEEGGRGWVEQFQRALDAFLGRRYGKAKIWRDERLRGNDDFSGEIFAQFPDTALMVSVISPSYLQSKWCRDEASKFCEIAQRPPGLFIDNKMRAFKVILEPVPNQDPLPAPMRDAIGFEFYVREDSRVRELDPAFGTEMKAKFLLAVGDLAGEIADLLRKLENAQAGVPSAAPGTGANAAAAVTSPAVYLAECNYDRREDRKALNAELRARNYRVLPDRELPRDEAEYRAEVARLLEQCVLSIHLVGSVYGSVPDGPSQCAGVAIQNELAVARAHSTDLKRVISLPAGTRSNDAKQQAFIEAIDRDPEVQFNAEVITAGIEAVKTAVQTALVPRAPTPVVEESGDAASIYVIFDAKDRKDEALLQLRKCLLACGFGVRKPAFDGDAVRRVHEGHLDECDAVLIYYGSGTDAWKQSVDRDVEKAKGRHRGRRLRAVFNWIAAPTCDDKDDVIAEGAAANLIDGRGGVSQSLVDEKIVKVLLGERP
jgi:TIR domain